jgi:Fur family zinc uptake transcriptional regulator
MTSKKKPLDGQLDLLEDRAAASGYHPTRLRRLVLGLLLETGAPVKAYDLVERARAKGHKLTPATVYRVLDHLLASGLVHRINSINSFVACNHPGPEAGHQPLILVCRDCRQATEIDDIDLAKALFNRLSALGHVVSGGGVEVQGLCPACASK